MNKKKKICVISFSDLRNDPRVRKQLFALKDTYDVTSFGLEKSGIKGINEFVIPDPRTFIDKTDSRITFLLARLFKSLYKHYIKKKYPLKDVIGLLKECRFDLLVANGLDALVIACTIAQREETKILFDAHEYEPRQIEDNWFHRLFVNPYKDFLCKKYLPFANTITTVSPGIAEEFNRVYSVKPEIIMNTPEYQKTNLQKVNPNTIRIIHHGIAHPSRKLENMIKIMPLLEERFLLTLMLIKGDKNYLNYLGNLTDRICPDRISFRSPVAFDFIVSELNHYDIGIIVYNPTSFNIKYALPNKLFEFIMAGLCIITGPSPEIKKIINEYNCGFAADSFNIENIAQIINSLTLQDIKEKKKASLKAAKFLNADNEMKKFDKIIRNLAGN